MRRYFLFLFILPSFLMAEVSQIDLKQVFESAPAIYTILSLLSTSAVMITLYLYLTSRPSRLMPDAQSKTIGEAIKNRDLQLALELCHGKQSLYTRMIATGIENRHFGRQMMLDAMKSTGQRHSTLLWQKISLLNDIAILAPMLGLLGTVSGMFYAFYDLNRSMESLTGLFDGLGISVGTTLAGLIVAILAMMLCTILKYRLTKSMTLIENEALSQAARLSHESHS